MQVYWEAVPKTWSAGSKASVAKCVVRRAVPEFGSGSGRNPAIFANPADIRLRPKLGRSLAGAGFGKLSLNNTNLNYL